MHTMPRVDRNTTDGPETIGVIASHSNQAFPQCVMESKPWLEAYMITISKILLMAKSEGWQVGDRGDLR